jgi:hypothetical protein
LHDIAHGDRLHLVGAKPGPRNRGANRRSAEIGSRDILEAAPESADRRSNRFCEDD